MERRDDVGPDAHDSTQGRIERASEPALGEHGDDPAEHLAEAEGSIAGVVGGAAIGSIAGPLGLLLGGVAGALGGWWVGHTIAEAAKVLTGEDDAHYRRHYAASPDRPADRAYEDVRPAYQLGQVAAQNPSFRDRTFDEVEPELRRGWTEDARARHGDWNAVRGYVHEGYARGSAAEVRPERAVHRAGEAGEPQDRP